MESNGRGVNSIGLLFLERNFACETSAVMCQHQGNKDGHLQKTSCFLQMFCAEELFSGLSH